MRRCQKYSWDEIREIVKNLFCEMNGNDHLVWGTFAELTWAEMAWNALNRNGLTSYSNECEKIFAASQILTLGAMYCKFIELYFGKPVYIDYDEWFVSMNLDIFHLENILGKTFTREFWETMIEREVILRDDEQEEYIEREIRINYCDDENDPDVTSAAVKALIGFQRQSVFSALVAAFGGIELLHISLLRTQESEDCREWIENGMQVLLPNYN